MPDTPDRGDTATVLNGGWPAKLVVDPELPDGFVVRPRSGRRLELPELRPIVDLEVAVALDGEVVAGAWRMSDFYSVGPALAGEAGLRSWPRLQSRPAHISLLRAGLGRRQPEQLPTDESLARS